MTEDQLKSALKTFNLSRVSDETGMSYMKLYRWAKQDGQLSDEDLAILHDFLKSILRG